MAQYLKGEILTNLMNFFQFVKILPFKVFFSNSCLHVGLIQFVKILLLIPNSSKISTIKNLCHTVNPLTDFVI